MILRIECMTREGVIHDIFEFEAEQLEKCVKDESLAEAIVKTIQTDGLVVLSRSNR